MNYTMGLSIGNLNDRSAVSVIQTEHDRIDCVHLQVWPPGFKHTEIFKNVEGMIQQIRTVKEAHVTVVADVTVSGVPMMATFEKNIRELNTIMHCYTITAGTSAEVNRVAKRELASVMRRVIEEERFHYAAGLEYADVLRRELQNFKADNTSTNDNEIDWRTRPNDDLILATALACWHVHRNLILGPLLLFGWEDDSV